MSELLSVTLDSSQTTVQPSLEEEAAKYDTPAPAEERPEWLPEKFKSPEDLAKAYQELQSKFSSRKTNQEPDEYVQEEEYSDEEFLDEYEAQEADHEVEDEARAIVEESGLDFDALSAKYWENGEIDEEDYASLEASGIPRHLVDQYIAGQEAVLEAARTSVISTVGGEDAYNSLTSWASDNFSAEEIDAYNRAVNSGDMQITMLAVKGLQARYAADNGSEPSRQVVGETVRTGADVYRSLAELQKDMSDRRYQNDPAFRRDVENKLARSDIM